MKTLSLLICFGLAGFACSKKDGDEAKKADETTDTKKDEGTSGDTKSGDTESGDTAKSGDAEPVICCDFKGAVGTSTKSKCEEGGGKVLADKTPPCT